MWGVSKKRGRRLPSSLCHDEVEKDGGGWVVVETQRKTREEPTREVESRTGRVNRMYPTLSKSYPVVSIFRQEEEFGRHYMKALEEEMKEELGKDARTARG